MDSQSTNGASMPSTFSSLDTPKPIKSLTGFPIFLMNKKQWSIALTSFLLPNARSTARFLLSLLLFSGVQKDNHIYIYIYISYIIMI